MARTENTDPRKAGSWAAEPIQREEGRPGSLGSSLRIYQRPPPNRPGGLGSLSGHDWDGLALSDSGACLRRWLFILFSKEGDKTLMDA